MPATLLAQRASSVSVKDSGRLVCSVARPVRAVARLAPRPRCGRTQTWRTIVCQAAATAEACEVASGPVREGPHWQQAMEDIAGGQKVTVVQIAPAVRVAIAETMGLLPGEVSTGQLVAGLRKLGFNHIFDTLFGADLTIMEEGTELLHRLQEHLEQHPDKDAPMPMFTSCCPGWVAMVEKSNPELIPYLSTCKSPQMMLGAVIKNQFAQQLGLAADKLSVTSIMPCVRKQGEADRPWFNTTGVARDVDHVITTAELGKLFTERGIKLQELADEEFDNPLGIGSGGGLLFGTTGGVMEAALRTVYEVVTQKPMGRINFEEVRGFEGIKEATLELAPGETSPFKQFAGPDGTGLKLRIAVANGLGNAKKLIKGLAEGKNQYDFIEVMACPGGCIGGGGQPRSADKQILQKRQAAMYSGDEKMTLRRSHENPFIQKLYQDFLGEPNGHKAHDLLHTHYVAGGVGDA